MSSAADSVEEGAAEHFDLVVLGASFTGIELVRQLLERRRLNLSVAVVDRQAAHPYIPLAHERLMRSIDPGGSSLDTRAYVERVGARFIEAEVEDVDIERHRVRLGGGRDVSGRFLVVALGSVMDPPEMPGAERFVAVKSAAQVTSARAALEASVGERNSASVVVVGGGISGVEVAGELAHVGRDGAPKLAVTLVHGGDRLLPGLCPRAGRLARVKLEQIGVRIELDTRVERLEEGDAQLVDADGQTRSVACDLAFWAGGLRPAPLLGRLALPRTDDGWIAVSPTLQCLGDEGDSDPDILAGGDAVRIQSGAGTWTTMQRAIECIWQAKLLARNIATLAGSPPGYGDEGPPPLQPHTLRQDFFHGVSVGPRSLIVWGPLAVDLGRVGVWFRRWLMRMYLARYASP